MTDEIVSRILIHSGILGQRWGIRRYRNYDGTLTEEGKERYSAPAQVKNPYISDDAAAAISSRSKGISALSNDELRQLIDRETLEIKYSDLQRQREAQLMAARGKSFGEKALDALTVAGTVASNVGKIADGYSKVKGAFGSNDNKGSSNNSSEPSAAKKKAEDMKAKADIEKSKLDIEKSKLDLEKNKIELRKLKKSRSDK